MPVNMFEDFLLPKIVLCEVMHFRERGIYIISLKINFENKCDVCAQAFWTS